MNLRRSFRLTAPRFTVCCQGTMPGTIHEDIFCRHKVHPSGEMDYSILPSSRCSQLTLIELLIVVAIMQDRISELRASWASMLFTFL
jgi:hypothetical protein